jgi:cytochrome P450 family 142 subfamily A polypeptide 1
VDLLDPELYGDIARMHDVFRGLRARPGLQRDTRNNLWAAVHHDDLIEVERNDRVFVSGQGFRATPSPMERDMIALDDPEHAEQRRLIARRFTPKSVKALEPFVVTLVDELIDAVIDDGELDVVDDLAAQMPARLTAHLLGFPEEIWADIKSWSERLMRYDETNRDETALQGFVGAIMEFSQVLGPLIEQRRAEPADDLVSVWAKSSLADCPMADDVIMQETGLVISGGAETTRTVIGRGLAELCSHSDQWEAIAVAPESIPVAVEELIRWVTPLNNFFRTATDDVRVGDVGVANGDRVILLYPSANRDEKHFDRPDELDLTRQPNPHVAFGFGTHFCLGASLARMELRVLLERMAARLTRLELLEGPDIEANIFVGAVRSCRIGFAAR